MYQAVKEWFADWNVVSIIVRLLIASLIGFLIGFDRERKNKSAGIRTHILVCLGTTLATLSSVYALQMFPDANVDVTRVAGQIVTGIGFIGAGVIFISDKKRVEGLTTAAGLWACTCCSIASGFGFFEGMIITAIQIILALLLLPLFERTVHHRRKQYDLYVEFDPGVSPAGFLRLLHTEDVSYTNYRVLQEDNGKEGPIAILSISMKPTDDKDAFLLHVRELDGLRYLHEHLSTK